MLTLLSQLLRHLSPKVLLSLCPSSLFFFFFYSFLLSFLFPFLLLSPSLHFYSFLFCLYSQLKKQKMKISNSC